MRRAPPHLARGKLEPMGFAMRQPSESEERIDLFVSYARSDDRDGSVAALVAAAKEEYAAFAAEELVVLFDRQPTGSLEDGARGNAAAAGRATVMLAALSPAYFASPTCREEWAGWLEEHLARTAPGERLPPIYATVLAGLEEAEAAAALRRWLGGVGHGRRSHVQPWRPDGVAALHREAVRRRLERLGRGRGERADASPTTLPGHDPHFVGRIEELRRVREIVALRGAVAALHGLGGVGKSALAVEYAHAFAADYPGGRFLVSAAGLADLRVPLVNLAAEQGILLGDEERRNIDAAFARVHAALDERPRSLLVLDGLDDPALLAAEHPGGRLLGGENVHVVVTTRLEPQRLPGVECLGVDALPQPDALRLLETHRPLASDAEWKAARQIVRRLGGHALAVQVVAVYLAHNAEVSCTEYLARLDRQGLAAVDAISRDDRGEPALHPQTLIEPLLVPTLDGLSPAETLTVEYAAVLPPDHVVVPWLRTLIGPRFPEMTQDEPPGDGGPWQRLGTRLVGLRLFTRSDDPRVARMHRLVQDVARARMGDEAAAARRAEVQAHAGQRARFLEDGWADRDNRWEIEPLLAYAVLRMAASDPAGASLANLVQKPMEELGRFVECRDLLRRAIALQESELGAEHPALATSCTNLAVVEHDLGNLVGARGLLHRAVRVSERAREADPSHLGFTYANLGLVEKDLGNLTEAHRLLRRAVAIQEDALGPDHPDLALSYSNLALAERELGNLAEARDLLHRAIAINEKTHAPDHPKLAVRYSNLAMVEQSLGNLREARRLLLRAIAINEKAFDPDHPTLAATYSNLAAVEQALGNATGARRLLRRAIAIDERVFDPDHPDLATSYSNLATVEQGLGNLAAARDLLGRAVAIDERAFEPDHPTLAIRYSNLAAVEGALGDFDEARRLLRRALAIKEKAFEPGHPALAVTCSNLAAIEQRLGNADEARALLRRAIDIEERSLDADHPKLATRYNNLAYVEAEMGNLAEARKLMRQAYRIRRARLGEVHPKTRTARRWLVDNDPEFPTSEEQ